MWIRIKEEDPFTDFRYRNDEALWAHASIFFHKEKANYYLLTSPKDSAKHDEEESYTVVFENKDCPPWRNNRLPGYTWYREDHFEVLDTNRKSVMLLKGD
jgi:hypothetical protein